MEASRPRQIRLGQLIAPRLDDAVALNHSLPLPDGRAALVTDHEPNVTRSEAAATGSAGTSTANAIVDKLPRTSAEIAGRSRRSTTYFTLAYVPKSHSLLGADNNRAIVRVADEPKGDTYDRFVYAAGEPLSGLGRDRAHPFRCVSS